MANSFLFLFSRSLIFPSNISFPSPRKLKDEITSKLAICQTKARRITGKPCPTVRPLEVRMSGFGSQNVSRLQSPMCNVLYMWYATWLFLISSFGERNGLKLSTLGSGLIVTAILF